MDNLSRKSALADLEFNIERLISEVSRLKSENRELKELVTKKDEVIKDFQNSTKLTKLVDGIGSVGVDADELRARIEENIQIIDDCIARLGDNVNK